MINLDDLKVAFPPNRRCNTEISTIPSAIKTRSSNKSSDGIYLLQISETDGEELPATAGVIKKMTEKADKTPEDMPQGLGVEVRALVHSGLDY